MAASGTISTPSQFTKDTVLALIQELNDYIEHLRILTSLNPVNLVHDTLEREKTIDNFKKNLMETFKEDCFDHLLENYKGTISKICQDEFLKTYQIDHPGIEYSIEMSFRSNPADCKPRTFYIDIDETNLKYQVLNPIDNIVKYGEIPWTELPYYFGPHHPDFPKKTDQLDDFKKLIMLYLLEFASRAKHIPLTLLDDPHSFLKSSVLHPSSVVALSQSSMVAATFANQIIENTGCCAAIAYYHQANDKYKEAETSEDKRRALFEKKQHKNMFLYQYVELWNTYVEKTFRQEFNRMLPRLLPHSSIVELIGWCPEVKATNATALVPFIESSFIVDLKNKYRPSMTHLKDQIELKALEDQFFALHDQATELRIEEQKEIKKAGAGKQDKLAVLDRDFRERSRDKIEQKINDIEEKRAKKKAQMEEAIAADPDCQLHAANIQALEDIIDSTIVRLQKVLKIYYDSVDDLQQNLAYREFHKKIFENPLSAALKIRLLNMLQIFFRDPESTTAPSAPSMSSSRSSSSSSSSGSSSSSMIRTKLPRIEEGLQLTTTPVAAARHPVPSPTADLPEAIIREILGEDKKDSDDRISPPKVPSSPSP